MHLSWSLLSALLRMIEPLAAVKARDAGVEDFEN